LMTEPAASVKKVPRKAIIKIKNEWCKSCGICVELCPKGVLEMQDGYPVAVRPEDCTLCLDCEIRCPDFAITVEQESDEKGS